MNNPVTILGVGVGLASGHLDACTHGYSAVLRLANNRTAIQTWLRTVSRGSHLAVESTGPLPQIAGRAGPGCAPWRPVSQPLQQLQALRMSLADLPVLGKVLLAGVLKRDKYLADKVSSVTSLPGIGLLNSAALLSVFGRLKYASADAVIAFLGMDMRPRDSGSSMGVRHVSKRGQPEFRRLLFNAARSAARTKTWQAYYQRELDKGLAPVQAANGLARRLMRVAFSLFDSGATFDPSKLSLKSA